MSSRLAWICLSFALALPAAAQNVLIWQLPGTINTFSRDNCPGVFAGSETVASFSGLTQQQFDAFDVIWIDGGLCAYAGAEYAEVFGTRGVWGPVVDGRVVVNTSDPDFHSLGGSPDVCRVIENAYDWLSDSAGTALYLSSGCAFNSSIPPENYALLDDTFGPGFAVSTGAAEAFLNTSHPLMSGPFAGPTSPTAWATFCHGSMPGLPSDFTSVATCVGGGSGFAYREQSECFTNNGGCDPLTECLYNPGGPATCSDCPAPEWTGNGADPGGCVPVIPVPSSGRGGIFVLALALVSIPGVFGERWLHVSSPRQPSGLR